MRLITVMVVALGMTATSAAPIAAAEADATRSAGADNTSDTGNTGQVTLYLSSNSRGAAGGIVFDDEDIVARTETAAGEQWSLLFDGSEAGLHRAADINGFAIEDTANPSTSDLLLTFDRPLTIPGLGRVDDSDIVRYQQSTQTFTEVVFDGSTVGLTSGAEDVDAIALVDGDLVISTLGNARAASTAGGTLLARDEDLLQVDGDGSGLTLIFDGSVVDLTAEDIVGLHVEPGGASETVGDRLHFAVLGRLIVPGLRGDGDDVTIFDGQLGDPAAGSFGPFFNGDTQGFRNEQIDGLAIGPMIEVPGDRFQTCNHPAGGQTDLVDFRALQEQGFDIADSNYPSPLSVQTVFELGPDRMRWGQEGVELAFDVSVPGPLDYTFRAELRSTIIDQPIPIGSTQMYCMRFEVDQLPDLYGPVTIFQRFNRDNDGPDLEVELTGANQFGDAVPNDIQVVAWDSVRHRTGVQLAPINTLMVVVYNHPSIGAYKVILNGDVLYQESRVGTNGSLQGSWPQFGLYPHGLHNAPNRQDQIDSGQTAVQFEYMDYEVVNYPNGTSNLSQFTVGG